jgi:peptidoglycan/xylan/chitin deacetylase (PgdA/CDA1 family)
MVCALTFDDGPSQWTEPILDLLDEHKQFATFFVTGAHIAGNESKLREMVADGQEIGVHGWTHRHLPTLTRSQVEDELYRTHHAIGSATGVTDGLWRAPYLDTDERVNAIATTLGLTHVGADVIVGDWNETDPQVIAQRVLDGLTDGQIVLLHDGIPPDGGSGTNTRQATVDAVALLLGTPGVTWCSVGELA